MIRLLRIIKVEARRTLGVLLAALCSLLLPKFLHDKCFTENRLIHQDNTHEGDEPPRRQTDNPQRHTADNTRNNTQNSNTSNEGILQFLNNTNNNNNFAIQEDFRVSIASRNSLSVEILDGGICLEEVEDDIHDDRQHNGNQNSHCHCQSRIQQAVAATLLKAEHAIEKLDLFASHFRADLTANMILSILQVLPPTLQRLQLGGLRLPVEELCKLMAHPTMADQLKHLALYDLEFSTSAAAVMAVLEDHLDTAQPLLLVDQVPVPSHLLALEEFVAVFIRMENRRVTLDPLIRFLQAASRLKQLELVMDHSHAYIHGYPRQPQPPAQAQVQAQQQRLPPQPQRPIFCATTWKSLLQATHKSLETIILEYVPLQAAHYQAMTDDGVSIKHLRLRDEPPKTLRGSNKSDHRIRALARLLERRSTLETISLDGLWWWQQQQQQGQQQQQQPHSHKRQSAAAIHLFRVLSQSTSIRTVRLRSLPMQLEDLRTLLQHNATLEHLSLHSMSFGDNSNKTALSNMDSRIHNTLLEDGVVEQAVFSLLVQILKDNRNDVALARLSWKQAEFRKTEVFPRRRKPRAFYRRYQCLQHHHQKKMKKSELPPSLQQQLHWYLTLNQRGIRKLMVDVNTTREQLLQQLLAQQQQGARQMQFLVVQPQPQAASAASTSSTTTATTAAPSQQQQQVTIQDASNREDLDEYALDCIYYLLSNNPSMIR